MPREHILVVEDEEDILELIRYNLAKVGFQVEGVLTGEQGLRQAGETLPDLILLDLMLPGIDGLTVCKHLKNDSATDHIPIIMLTAKGEEADVISGLEMGADDYIIKPFSPKILVARARAVLRRQSNQEGPEDRPLLRGSISIHPGRHEVRVDDQPVQLTATEFRILQLLARRPGWVFTRDQVIGALHNDEYTVTDRSVDVQIMGLRKKLGQAGSSIETVRGIGYRYQEE